MKESNYLKKLFEKVFHTNHKVKRGQTHDSVYLIGLNNESINNLARNSKVALLTLKREFKIINCKNKTFKEIAKDLCGEMYSSEKKAWDAMEDIQLYKDIVIVFKELSKAKLYREKIFYFKNLIKITDDAHYKGISPKSDIVFIDSATFLEKYYEEIGLYLVYNLWPNNESLSEFLVKSFHLKSNLN